MEAKSKEISAHPITTDQSYSRYRKEEPKNDNEHRVPAVLPHVDFILIQVADVCKTRLMFLLED